VSELRLGGLTWGVGSASRGSCTQVEESNLLIHELFRPISENCWILVDRQAPPRRAALIGPLLAALITVNVQCDLTITVPQSILPSGPDGGCCSGRCQGSGFISSLPDPASVGRQSPLGRDALIGPNEWPQRGGELGPLEVVSQGLQRHGPTIQ